MVEDRAFATFGIIFERQEGGRFEIAVAEPIERLVFRLGFGLLARKRSSAGRHEFLGARLAPEPDFLLAGPSGFHSIRINDQWRLIFVWRDDGAYEVGIVDYH